MGAFDEARRQAREEAGLDRMKETERAKRKIGETVGKAEARLREPLSDKAVRAVAGSPGFFRTGFFKKVGRGAKAIGQALNRAGKKFDQKAGGQNTRLRDQGGVSRNLGGSLGRSILGEEKTKRR